MPHRGVAGDGFHLMHGAGRRSTDQGTFDAAMLKTERYFQMKDLFAVTLKAEMPRFNDAGMHRANRNFMYFIPFNTIEIHHSRGQATTVTVAPETFPLAQRLLKAYRLEPGMSLWTSQTLLGNLPFKKMQLGTHQCQRGKSATD